MSIQPTKFRQFGRKFLGAAMLIALLTSANSCKKETLDPFVYPERSFEITELEIRTRNLDSSRIFWSQTLPFELIDSTAGSFTVKIGTSRLKFRPSGSIDPPVNHFAITIPKNQIERALDWLKNPDGKYSDGPKNPIRIIRDEATGAEIISDPKMNTRSVYFDDGAGNIIELVAKKDFGTEVIGDFSKDQFLKISEVALVTKNIQKCLDILSEKFNVQQFPGSTSGYKPVGGGDGIILLIVPNKPWTPTESIVATSYETSVTIRFPVEMTISIPNFVTYSNFTLKTEP